MAAIERLAWVEENPIRVARYALGLTQKDVSAYLGVSLGAFVAWENVARHPHREGALLPLIAHLLRLDPEELRRKYDAWMLAGHLWTKPGTRRGRTPGHIVTAETRRRISEAKRGHIVTAETRRKISEANLGHVVAVETRRKMSEAKRGHVTTAETRMKISEANLGHIVTAETRRKISAGHQKRKR